MSSSFRRRDAAPSRRSFPPSLPSLAALLLTSCLVVVAPRRAFGTVDFGRYDRLRSSDSAYGPHPSVTRVTDPETQQPLTLRHFAYFAALT